MAIYFLHTKIGQLSTELCMILDVIVVRKASLMIVHFYVRRKLDIKMNSSVLYNK